MIPLNTIINVSFDVGMVQRIEKNILLVYMIIACRLMLVQCNIPGIKKATGVPSSMILFIIITCRFDVGMTPYFVRFRVFPRALL